MSALYEIKHKTQKMIYNALSNEVVVRAGTGPAHKLSAIFRRDFPEFKEGQPPVERYKFRFLMRDLAEVGLLDVATSNYRSRRNLLIYFEGFTFRQVAHQITPTQINIITERVS